MWLLFIIFKVSNHGLNPSRALNLSDFSFCLIYPASSQRKSSALKRSCDLIGPNQIILDNLYFMKVKVKVKLLSCVRLFTTPWTVSYQVPPSIGFSRQECWSGLPFPSPGDLPNLGIESWSPTLQASELYQLSYSSLEPPT